MTSDSWVGVTNAYVSEHASSLRGAYVDVLACKAIAAKLDVEVNASLTAEYRRYFQKLEALVATTHTAAQQDEEDALLSPRY
jgi:hypothetical protein